MKKIPKERPLAELINSSVKPTLLGPGPTNQAARLDRVNPAVQLRMRAKQPAESGANHARHHVGRRTQS